MTLYPQAQQGFPQQTQPQYAQPQQQGFAQQAQPQFPQYPQPQQGFGQQLPQAQPQSEPLAKGTLDDYFGQPTSGGGPSVSWKNKAPGSSIVGVVSRDVMDADVQQDTDPQSRQPKFYRDGRPKFVMKVPLRVEPSADFPEGEAQLYVRGHLRDELVRAMGAAGVSGAPKAGAGIVVTLVERRPGAGAIPQNVFAVDYRPGDQTQTPAPQSQQQQQQQQQQQSAPAPQPEPAPQPTPQPEQQPAAQLATPSGLSDDQAALLARLTGGQA